MLSHHSSDGFCLQYVQYWRFILDRRLLPALTLRLHLQTSFILLQLQFQSEYGEVFLRWTEYHILQVLMKPFLICSCIIFVLGWILLAICSSFELHNSTASRVPIAGFWLLFVGGIFVNCCLQVRRFQVGFLTEFKLNDYLFKSPDPVIADYDAVGSFFGAGLLILIIVSSDFYW